MMIMISISIGSWRETSSVCHICEEINKQETRKLEAEMNRVLIDIHNYASSGGSQQNQIYPLSIGGNKEFIKSLHLKLFLCSEVGSETSRAVEEIQASEAETDLANLQPKEIIKKNTGRLRNSDQNSSFNLDLVTWQDDERELIPSKFKTTKQKEEKVKKTKK